MILTIQIRVERADPVPALGVHVRCAVVDITGVQQLAREAAFASTGA